MTFHQGSFYSCLVRVKGLEPPRRGHKILSLTRLPISPYPQIFSFLIDCCFQQYGSSKKWSTSQVFSQKAAKNLSQAVSQKVDENLSQAISQEVDENLSHSNGEEKQL